MIPGSEFAPVADNPPDLGAQLSCSDPDDMRAIWRRAALALGATEEEAIAFVLVRHYDRYYRLTRHGGWPAESRSLGSDIWEPNLKRATGALCRAVWGPK